MKITIEIGHFCLFQQRPYGGWIRWKQRAIHWTAAPPLFSERNSHVKPFLTVGKLRFFSETSVQRLIKYYEKAPDSHP